MKFGISSDDNDVRSCYRTSVIIVSFVMTLLSAKMAVQFQKRNNSSPIKHIWCRARWHPIC